MKEHIKKMYKLYIAVATGILETIIVKVLNKELKWSVSLVVFLLGVLAGCIILEICSRCRNIKIYINNRFKTKIKTKKVKGFFEREEIIKDIIKWHREGERFQIGIVYGFGGSGKTELARNFEKAARNYCYAVVIDDNTEFPNVKYMNDNTIIFIDYIYEYVKRRDKTKEIKKFISECRRTEKKISVILLERTNLVELVLQILDFDKMTTKKINLNEPGVNNEKLLKEIFRHHLKTYNDIEINDFVNLIRTRFDYKYSRPIFARIMSELKNRSQIDFKNLGGQYRLIEEYWKYRLKKKEFDSFFDEITEHMGGREDVNIIRTMISDKAETLIVFCILTSFSIIIDDTGGMREIIIKHKNGNIYESNRLAEKVKSILTIGESGIKIRNIMLAQMFPIEKENVECNRVTILIDEYDIIAAWLLNHVLKRGENEDLIELIKIVNADIGNVILSFVTRGSEDDKGYSLLWWQQNFLLDAFRDWNEEGYEEWLKNCLDIYAISDDCVKESVFHIIEQFIKGLDKESDQYRRIYSYIMWLGNDFRAKGRMESIELINKLDLQEPNNTKTRTL